MVPELVHSPDLVPYYKFDLPEVFFNNLRRKYMKIREKSQNESIISIVFNQLEVGTKYIPIDETDLNILSELVRHELSRWLNISENELVQTSIYGAREYRRGSIIRWHVDPDETQPFTAIIHIADSRMESNLFGNGESSSNSSNEKTCEEDLDKSEWELQISSTAMKNSAHDNSNIINVLLNEGEVLLFESARLPHARIKPLKLSWYSNAFIHYSPRNWNKIYQHID
jgi:hypothetical protein